MKYYLMYHRGGLDESLKTKKRISFTEFRERFEKFHYTPYAYDKRMSCIRFIISDMEINYNEPTWLLLEDDNRNDSDV